MQKCAGVLTPLVIGAMIPNIVRKGIERARSTQQQLDNTTYDPMPKIAAMPSWLTQAGQQIAGNFAQAATSPLLGKALPSIPASGFRGSVSNLGAAPLQGIAQGVSSLAGSPMQGVAGGISGSIQKLMERNLLSHGREFGEKKDPFHLSGSAAITAFGKEMGTSGADLLRDMATKAMEAAGHAGDASAREAILQNLKRSDSVLANADDGTLMEAYHTMTRFAPTLSTDKNAVRSFLRQAVMSGSGPDYMSIKLLADAERAVTGGGKKE